MDDSQFQTLGRLQAQARSQAAELDALQTQTVLKAREAKKCAVVQNEINSLMSKEKEGLRMYKAFGKAFVLEKPNVLTKEYKSTEREAVVDGEALQRKIKWLEKELKSSQTSLQEFYARIQFEEQQQQQA